MKRLDLLRFAPFRLNRLAAEFSAALAADYMDSFGLDVPEWRVLATLGARSEACSAQYIVRCTRTHKSRISRAVNQLLKDSLVERIENETDRRELDLRLTAKGRNVYEQLVPLLLAREKRLLSVLEPEERQQMDRIMDKLETAFDLVRSTNARE